MIISGLYFTGTLKEFRERYENAPKEDFDIKNIKEADRDDIIKYQDDFWEIYRRRFSKQPEIFKGSDIPLHHKLYTWTNSIREVLIHPEPDSDYKRIMLEKIDEIDEQFAQLKPIEKDCVFYRGAGSKYEKDVLSAARPGDIVVPDIGYSYTAFRKSLADEFTGSIKYEIRVPKGAKVSRNNEHGGEAIMPRSAQYKLISKEPDPTGKLNVILEYIL
jgi:hypothetical protein